MPLALGLSLLAGCGGSFSSSPGGLQLQATARAVHTGEPVHLSAIPPGGEDSAHINWRVLSGNNAPALGNGSISSSGIYTPPTMLSRDLVTVIISAAPESDPGAAPTTITLAVAAGFAQPLQPENATLAPGSTLQVRAQLAEVGAGNVSWRLENDAGTPVHELGALGEQHCERGSRQFTTCTVTYTAPPSLEAGVSGAPPRLWLVARARGSTGAAPATSLPPATTRARLMLGSLNSNPALHQSEQRGPIALGGSGSNDNDFDTYLDAAGARFVADCCGGTLGALVEDQFGTPYILSNNHVLATSDQGQPGDPIEQPGLIDDGCVPLTKPNAQLHAVGTLAYAAPLAAGSGRPAANVDAALASTTLGAVDPGGAILELGSESLGNSMSSQGNTLRSAPPVAGTGERLDPARLAGLLVAKSGRTTGLTCSSVDAVNLRVAVDYYKDCAETQPYTTRVFTGQIAIGGEAFADSGDSGALVVDAANAQAVGLLYATATSGGPSVAANNAIVEGLSLANPIADVLNELGAQSGSTLTIRGTSQPHRVACLDYDSGDGPARPALAALTPDERNRVAAAVEAASALRSRNPFTVLAVRAGASADDPGRGAVYLYLDRLTDPAELSAVIPETLLGVRTVLIRTDPGMIERDPPAWPTPSTRAGLHLSASALAFASATAERLAARLMESPAIFGVGVAQSFDNPAEPAILVLLDTDQPLLATLRILQQLAGNAAEVDPDQAASSLPATLGGLRVRYLRMHRFRVTQSKYIARGAPSSCEARDSSPSE